MIIFAIIVLIVSVLVIVTQIKRLSDPNRAKFTTLLDHVSGLDESVKNVVIEFRPDKIELIGRSKFGFDKYTLKMEKIVNAEIKTEKEILELNKSVIGRAVIGSVFFGIGAIVGAISGIGTKKKTLYHNYLIFYVDTEESEGKMYVFAGSNIYNALSWYKKMGGKIQGFDPSKLTVRNIDLSEEKAPAASIEMASTSHPGQPTSDIPSQIKKLAELKESGILTESEFEQKKTELLSRM